MSEKHSEVCLNSCTSNPQLSQTKMFRTLTQLRSHEDFTVGSPPHRAYEQTFSEPNYNNDNKEVKERLELTLYSMNTNAVDMEEVLMRNLAHQAGGFKERLGHKTRSSVCAMGKCGHF